MYTYTYIIHRICMCIYMCTCMCVCIYVHVQVHAVRIRMYTNVYVYIYIYTNYICLHIYRIHIWVNVWYICSIFVNRKMYICANLWNKYPNWTSTGWFVNSQELLAGSSYAAFVMSSQMCWLSITWSIFLHIPCFNRNRNVRRIAEPAPREQWSWAATFLWWLSACAS